MIEVSNAGTAISPSNGFPHTWYYPSGIAIDPSGNVWVGTENKDTSTASNAGTTGPGGAAAGGSVTEIIGAAVPVITPIAAGLPTTAGGPVGSSAAATAHVTLTGSGATLNGTVTGITITNGGFNYLVAPTVTISAPNTAGTTGMPAAQATATATITNGARHGCNHHRRRLWLHHCTDGYLQCDRRQQRSRHSPAVSISLARARPSFREGLCSLQPAERQQQHNRTQL